MPEASEKVRCEHCGRVDYKDLYHADEEYFLCPDCWVKADAQAVTNQILDTRQCCCIRQHDNGDTVWVARMGESVWWLVIVGKGQTIQITAGLSFYTREEIVTQMCELYGD